MTKKKYFSEEERKMAQRELNRRYKETHKEEILKQRREYRESPRGRAIYMVKNLKQADRNAGRGECTITAEWIEKNIFTQPCHYCGETDFLKLGCDRIDNTKPHTPENVVCSCWTCNNKRNTMPFDEFVAKCKTGEIAAYLNRPDCSKPCVAINDAGEVVYEFPSASEAERSGGYKHSAVSAACRGCFNREGNHTYKGLNWYYR